MLKAVAKRRVLASMSRDGALPDAIYRLLNPVAQRANLGGHDPAPATHPASEDVEDEWTGDEDASAVRTVGGIHVVRNLTLPFFQSKLVRHFDIAFKRNEVQWPRRLARKEPPATIL